MIFKKNLFLWLILFMSANIYSQTNKINYNLSHPIKFGAENLSLHPKTFSGVTDSFKVVAILAQFQEDNDSRTSGNGRFDLSNKYFNPSTGRDTVVDAPPYDSAYFADHLKFLKNYFEKSSKGKLNLSYDLFGAVISLPNKMESYSPQRNESNVKLGNLFQDAWARADSFINFSSYDLTRTAFVIFHAGVGRDVDLSSILGFDPTPFDIPSVYLGLKNLREFYGNNYNGFQTSDGVFITNSLIIPSTELRELNLISGNTLIELGMNGILTASFGSYIGLPDLFNTVNGKTAIGRFGLMDGQSLFSYNGIFPPEPSAWEKIYLGWIEPVVISSGSVTYKIVTSSKNLLRDSTVYKVLISSKEYFLIENKNRDPENNGQTIYSRNRSFIDSTNYPKDLENGFYYSNSYTSLYLLNGNVTDVETFDWSLPGLIDNNNNYKGGILIWHIDENVIDSKISTNSINNDIDHKGVDLEEAKGAQEIGVTFNTPFGAITGDGTPVDYWFNGFHAVPSSIYKNSFTPTSNPNSLSYSFANNNIFITEFSVIDTLMTFKVSVGGIQLSPLAGFPKFVGGNSSIGYAHPISFDFNGDGSEEFFVNNGGDLYGFKNDGTSISTDSTGLLLQYFGHSTPSVAYSPSMGNSLRFIATSYRFNGKLGFFHYNNNYQLVDSIVDNFQAINAIPLVFDSNMVVIGVGNKVFERKLNGQPSGYVDSIPNFINVNEFTKTIQTDYIFSDNQNYIVTGNILGAASLDTFKYRDNSGISYSLLLNGKNLISNYTFNTVRPYPVLADLDKDGKQEIIFIADDKLYAVNSNGVLLDNFPVNFDKKIRSEVIVGDVNNDNIFDLVFVAENGDLYAYGTDGKIVNGFPVKVGPNTISSPAFSNMNDSLGILVYAGDGYLYAFKTNSRYDENKILWKNHLKDKYHSNNNFKSVNVPVNYTEKLPSDKVYNWPNPVYANETFIRYYLNGNASSVNIKILDLSGELVTTLKGTTFSKSDNEVRWDASSVQSGVYYGVVEADIDGSTETKIIKMAVVK